VIGTIAYMSPEQARGLSVDTRTDIFSLGVMLYEMIAGRAPFAGTTPSDCIAEILKTEPPPLTQYSSEIPTELASIVSRALSKETDERYQTARELLDDLRTLKHDLELAADLGNSQRPGLSAKSGQSQTELWEINPTAERNGNRTQASGQVVRSVIERHKRIALLAAALLVTVALFASLYFFRSARSNEHKTTSIVVLPFTNASNDPNMEYLSDGISESLIDNLSQLPQLKVIARSSAFKYKGKDIDPQAVAKALGVEVVLTGRVEQRGDNL
jgi:serine/threonine protein kinase